ncbi:MAG: ABC transporter ATP-binding protein, partial [Acidimicrobiales bacterium]|nr:ABC transporter ATP-binding protein [Acidimicrobiales bacterium]
DLSAGDLALFVGYVTTIANLSRWAGRVSTYYRQAEVSVDRLAELSHDRTRPPVVIKTATNLRHGPPPLVHRRAEVEPLEVLSVDRLSAVHDAESGRVVPPVSFEIRAGELVVVSGPVGSGKSMLLRAVLGLVESTGSVYWNGEVIDPATFLVPPRTAYLPQVPRLFSEALADTVLLGMPDDELDQALWTACMESDVASMGDGVDTVVGPRGMRLSGGQAQRTAAARALVRRPQLLIVDDMSSALDVETELMLWQRLRSTYRPAMLMVSHRPAVVEMADTIVELG